VIKGEDVPGADFVYAVYQRPRGVLKKLAFQKRTRVREIQAAWYCGMADQ
jgi:hypothetical protein